MKKIIYLLSIILLLASLLGCSDDDKKSSSITGVDFSSDVALDRLDTYVLISGTDEEFKIMLASKNAVTSSELTINGLVVETSEWFDLSDYDELFRFVSWCDVSMLPQNVIIEPGVDLSIEYSINGTSYSYEGMVAHVPNLQPTSFDPEEDFTMNWTLAANSDVQVAAFYGESFSWEGDDEIDLAVELSGDKRTHTFSQSNFTDYIEEGLIWYDYSVEAINYQISGKHIFVLSSEHYIESEMFKASQESQIIKAHKLIKNLAK